MPTLRNRSQISYLILHIKELEKEETQPKVRRKKKKVTKIRAEINKIDARRTTEKVYETKNWLFEMINRLTNL